ncbi:hypothetical protein [Pseudodesulfovibrio portus]|uniref:Uncharacterized protein n=1 Tax=Pseudodesulfovibrio portus TaxID=231439 RepID=A0ABN6RYC5_9BACT|nr:hypothetical protein [Pseudodesulfovibrio portus]BDQ35042.1 hypothetical protein JCM14722_25840 [Pseudodesulfovibrio portus]
MKRQSNTTPPSRETLRGVIVPSQWDNEFRVTGMLIACPGEREVRVANLEAFPMLHLLERTEVELTGTVRKDGIAETIHIDRIQSLCE